MRAYSMDLRERVLLDSDAGMKAAEGGGEVPRERVVGAALETATARKRARWRLASSDMDGAACSSRTCTPWPI